MTNALQIRSDYNEKREKLKEKLSSLFIEKDEKRKAINLLFVDDAERKRVEHKSMRKKSNTTWQANQMNKDLWDTVQGLRGQIKSQEVTFQEVLKNAQKLEPAVDEQALRRMLLGEDINTKAIETPPEVQAFRAGWKNGIKDIDEDKKERMIATAEKLIQDGHFYFEQKAGLAGPVAVFHNLPGLQEDVKLYDVSREFDGIKSDDLKDVDYAKEYRSRTPLQRKEIKLQAVSGEKVEEWKDGPVKQTMQRLQKDHGARFQMKSQQEKLFSSLDAYYKKKTPNDNLSKSDANAFCMYLTSYYGWYRLGDYDKSNSSRRCQKSRGGIRVFNRYFLDFNGAGFLVCL